MLMDHSERASRSIIFATTADLAALNASSLHLIGLANAFDRQGWHVSIASPTPSGPFAGAISARTDIVQTPSIRRFGLPHGAAIPLMLPALRRLTHSRALYVRSGIGTVALVYAARAAGFERIVVESNGWFADDLAILGKSSSWQRLAQRLQIAEAHVAASIRVVTRGLGDLLTAHGIAPAKIHHIPNGTDIGLFQRGDRVAARRLLRVDPQAELLVFVGNLWPAIDLDTLFQAASMLANERPRLQIMIVGDGVSRGKFEAKAGAVLGAKVPVRWMGSQSTVSVNDALAAADVAIAPFIAARNARIGLSPLKLYDYAAAGRVVVATALPGIIDIAPQPWLHLAAPHDARSYARAITDALTVDRENAERRARTFAEQHFGWETVAARVAELY
jgi:glycosyltransferase involved in cell wall biosynthesis